MEKLKTVAVTSSQELKRGETIHVETPTHYLMGYASDLNHDLNAVALLPMSIAEKTTKGGLDIQFVEHKQQPTSDDLMVFYLGDEGVTVSAINR